MIDLQWTPDVDSWALSLSNSVFDELEIRVATDGESDPPTARQQQAVAVLCNFTTQDRDKIRRLARRWAEENMVEHELEDMEDEDFEYDVTGALVPRLRDSEALYFILTGRSEIEPEHGLGCVCKDGTQFTICHPDHAYQDYDWDSVDVFEALLAGSP